MSKAFTSEETPESGPVVRPPPRLAPGEVRYVTPEGFAALRSEREALAPGDPRAALLDATLAALTILPSAPSTDGKVSFGSWVTVVDGAGSRVTWRIVGPDEADPRRGLVSAHSPVGRALLGRQTGEEVEVERPGGRAEYEIVAVSGRGP